MLVDSFDRHHRNRNPLAYPPSRVFGDDATNHSNTAEEISTDPSARTTTTAVATKMEKSSSKKTASRPFFLSPVRAITGAFQRTSLLLERAFRQVWRDVDVNIARMSVYTVLAVLIGKVYGGARGAGGGGGGGGIGRRVAGRGFSRGSISGRVNTIANAGINVAMLSMIKTLQIFKKEKIVVDRERAQGLVVVCFFNLLPLSGVDEFITDCMMCCAQYKVVFRSGISFLEDPGRAATGCSRSSGKHE